MEARSFLALQRLRQMLQRVQGEAERLRVPQAQADWVCGGEGWKILHTENRKSLSVSGWQSLHAAEQSKARGV